MPTLNIEKLYAPHIHGKPARSKNIRNSVVLSTAVPNATTFAKLPLFKGLTLRYSAQGNRPGFKPIGLHYGYLAPISHDLVTEPGDVTKHLRQLSESESFEKTIVVVHSGVGFEMFACKRVMTKNKARELSCVMVDGVPCAFDTATMELCGMTDCRFKK